MKVTAVIHFYQILMHWSCRVDALSCKVEISPVYNMASMRTVVFLNGLLFAHALTVQTIHIADGLCLLIIIIKNQ